MLYFKRAVQLIFLFTIIFLTIQNYEMKADLKIFTKEIPQASVVLVVFFSILIGLIIAAFFSALKDYKSAMKVKKANKETKKIGKELELVQKDLMIAKAELDKITLERNKLSTEIETLKEIVKSPEVKNVEQNENRYLDF
ncbi:MAG: hypothetical protein CSA15_03865 [Candidatus Delongbacteria bacterium]|nr:MAG: hypothetical protein CSA15_03865 [Candidatus Delongbacteria bacterium]